MSLSEDNECDELTLTPSEIQEAARAVIENLLLPQSKEKYSKTYEGQQFNIWNCTHSPMWLFTLANVPQMRSIHADEDKLLQISDHLIMGINGDSGDVLQFSQFVANNLALYQIKNGYKLNTAASVHFTRKSLADSYRNGTPFLMNFLVGGWDEQEGGQLYVLDHLATCVRVPCAAHGFGGMFGISILQYYHQRDMTESQAYEVLQMAVKEIHHRLFLNLPNFQVKVVSKHGISSLPIVYAPRIVASPGIDISKGTGTGTGTASGKSKGALFIQ